MANGIGAMTWLDGGTIVFLAAFATWGALRGALRQVLALGVLALAFPLAARHGPSLESSVAKAVSVSGADQRALAWALAFVLVVLAGWVALALLQPLLARLRLPGRGERIAGGLLGFAHGAFLLTVLGLGVVVAHPTPPRPPWVETWQGTPSANLMRGLRRSVLRAAPLPRWLERRVVDAESRIGKRTSTVVQRRAKPDRTGPVSAGEHHGS